MVFDHPEFDGHEQVLFCGDAASELRAIIAVHSTALGPAAGGCRMFPYASFDDALTDVLRLSRGMSYKNAVAGLALGGGKAVIVADPGSPNKADLLRALATHVQSLGGRYWTSIDVGVGPKDADVLAERCDYVFARAAEYPEGFNPSEFTALGGFAGVRAVARHVFGRDDQRGMRVAVQGLGSAGSRLCRLLLDAGAELVVADISEHAVASAVDSYGATAVDPAAIHAQAVDIFAPCALGGVVNDATLSEIQARAVCGLANNQLAEPRHGAAMWSRRITYVPDYVVNAGGMIGASGTIFGKHDEDASRRKIEGIYDTILEILRRSDATGRPPFEIADDLARGRIAAARAPLAASTPS
jgi:leucine dehydrogenase